MSDSIDPHKLNVCPICGSALSDAAGGLCPRCVMVDAAQPTNVPGAAPGSALPSQAEVTAAFPQFEIVELIGKGGMGTVWKARQPTLNRHVALKLLPASLAERDPAFAERFAREGQLLARLHHPNIVAVHDSGRAGDFFYIVMEFVDGVNLRQAMCASRFTPQQALAIVPKICDALQYAHDEGVLHRDIKPENILLDAKGRVKLVDFGIAKLIAQPEAAFAGGSAPMAAGGSLTLGDATLGTPNYMAPEQIEKPADVDNRADIYSLGVVFYELLTGELPLGKFAPPSEKSAADPRLDGIVRQALEKQRDRRQQSVGEMRTQVETIAGEAHAESDPVAGAAFRNSRFSRTAIVGAFWIPFFFAATAFIAFEPHRGRIPFPYDYTFIATFLLFSSLAGSFGTTILGWIAVSQIRRSRGKLYGLWLAVFDGLFFPLLAVDALIIAVDLIGRSHEVASRQEGVRLVVRNIPGSVTLLLLAVIIVVDFLIIRAVWRAANKSLVRNGTPAPSARPNDPNPKLKLTLVLHAVLFTLVGALFVVGIPLYLALLRSLHNDGFNVPPPHGLRLSFLGGIGGLVIFPLAFGVDAGLCFLARKLGGRLGLRMWSGFVAVGLVLFVAKVASSLWLPMSNFVEYVNPAADRMAMEQRLRAEIESAFQPRSTRCKNLSVLVAPDLNTASVDMSDLQEMKGIDGKNVWTNISGSLSARHTGEGTWVIQGDGMLGYITLVVPMADLMGNARTQQSAPVSWKFGPVTECVLPFDRSFIDFQTGNILHPDLQKPPPVSPEEWDAWIKQTGADAMVEEASKLPSLNADDFPRLVALNNDSCVFVSEQTADFESARASDAELKLKIVDLRKLNWGFADSRPRPWWFRTKDGATGLLQILGANDQQRGLKIRYKLIAPENTATLVRSRFPIGVQINRDHHTVYVVHDQVDVHYVFYYAGDFDSSWTGSQNRETLAWQDEGRIKLPNGRTFDFHRESDDPMHVHINNYGADLSVGRVTQLLDDGTPIGTGWSVPLKVALDPLALAHLIANPGTGQNAMRDANLSFGPVIEREVKGGEAIDFDSGKQSKMPEFDAADKGFGGIGERAAGGATWMEKQQIDAFFDGHSLNAFGMKVRALENKYWDEWIPSELSGSIACIDPKAPPQVLLAPAKDGPATYAFQTREGGKGILQVLATSDDGVKLRYKLVQTQSAPLQTMNTPATHLPAPVVTLLDIERHQWKGVEAWQPDGSPLPDNVRGGLIRSDVHPPEQSDGRPSYLVSLLVSNPPPDEIWDGGWNASFGDGAYAPILQTYEKRPDLQGSLFRLSADFAKEQPMANIRFGIAIKPRRTLLVLEGKRFEVTEKAVPFERSEFLPKVTVEADIDPQGTRLGLINDTPIVRVRLKLPEDIRWKWDWHVMVQDKNGREIHANQWPRPSADPYELIGEYDLASVADVSKIVLQGRSYDKDYQWAEFPNVPLQPAGPAPKAGVLTFGPVVEREVNDLQTSRENCALSFDSGKFVASGDVSLGTLKNLELGPVAVAWAKDHQVDAVGFVKAESGGLVKCGLLCPQVLAIPAKNSAWDSATPALLKKEFDREMSEWRFIPEVAEVTSDGKFPTTYLLLDTRTHKMGVLQITGVAENPTRVKIRYKLVQSGEEKTGAAVAPPTPAEKTATATDSPVLEALSGN